jgi:predicted nucleotidyltransferase
MAGKKPIIAKRTPRYYHGAEVPAAKFRRFARQFAEQFRPDRIILFGSHAYGSPTDSSDGDILVVQTVRNEFDQSFKIHSTLLPPFPLDLIVRTPKNLAWWLAEGDSFLTEVVSRGKVLYEKADAGVGAKGRGRSADRPTKRPLKTARNEQS